MRDKASAGKQKNNNFATFLTSLSVCFLCVFALIIAFIFSILHFSGNVESSKVYAQSEKLAYFECGWLADTGRDSKSFKSFTSSNLNVYNVFSNQQIKVIVKVNDKIEKAQLKADDGIVVDSGKELSDGTALADGFIEYLVVFKATNAGEYNLTLIGEYDSGIYFDSLIINAYNSIDNFSLLIEDDFITDNQNVAVELCYNEHSEMVANDLINFAISLGSEVYNVTREDFSSLSAIKAISNEKIVIDTALIDKSVKDIKITAKIAGKVAETTFSVQDLDLPTTAILSSATITYLLSDEIGLYSIYLNENSKPILEIVDNDNVVEFSGLKKVESDKAGYDKFVLSLNLLNITDYSNVLIKISGQSGVIYKVVGVRVIDKIKTIKLSEQKRVYDNKSGIYVGAIVNGYDDYASSVEWYVNDIKVNQTDSILNFVAKGGTYNVYAQIGDVKSETVSFTVKYSKGNVITWYIILAVCVVAMIVLYFTRKKKGKINMFGTLNENIDELIAGVRVLDNKFSVKGAKKFYRNMTIVKERLWHAYEENEEGLYKLANSSMQIAYKSAKKLTGRVSEDKRKELINGIIDELNKANDALLEYKRLCNMNENGGE